MLSPPGLSPETGHFYFLWFFLFSLHSVADQIGAAPITCQRNVPALPSITSLTRAGRVGARSRPQTAPRAATPYLVNLLGFACTYVLRAHTDQHTGLHSRMFPRHRRSQWCHHVIQHVLPCSAAYVMSAA